MLHVLLRLKVHIRSPFMSRDLFLTMCYHRMGIWFFCRSFASLIFLPQALKAIVSWHLAMKRSHSFLVLTFVLKKHICRSRRARRSGWRAPQAQATSDERPRGRCGREDTRRTDSGEAKSKSLSRFSVSFWDWERNTIHIHSPHVLLHFTVFLTLTTIILYYIETCSFLLKALGGADPNQLADRCLAVPSQLVEFVKAETCGWHHGRPAKQWNHQTTGAFKVKVCQHTQQL